MVRVHAFSAAPVELASSDRATMMPPVGDVDLGDLRRAGPIGRDWGFERGRPIDRYYIERFLQRHAGAIHGRVLEFGHDKYTRRFGAERVTRCDVMNVQSDISGTTIRSDLTECDEIADATFDCIVCTQVLQLIYDLPAAVRHLHRILKPGGQLLATFSGISCAYAPGWGYFNWSLTPASAERLLGSVFADDSLEVDGYGNLLACVAFLAGLSVEDLRDEELEPRTVGYELIVSAWATRTRNLS